MENKIIKIFFRNKDDLKSKIVKLWQDQKKNEIYEFHFADKESEDEMNNLILCFADGQQGASESSLND